jgi:dihydroxyacetone synthase
MKMRACGWDVIDIEDGCFDVEGLVDALNQARASIGLGSAVAGDAVAHGVAFDAFDLANMKKAYDFNPEEHSVVSKEVRKFFEDIPARGQNLVQCWEKKVQEYEKKYPKEGVDFSRRVMGHLTKDWKDLVPSSFPDTPTATRKSSGLVFNSISEKVNNLMVGTADLSPSVSMTWKGKVDFQHVRNLRISARTVR